jgi:putative ABC transport system substrate-binding protein
MSHLKRREFIGLIGGAVAAWPLAAHAQQPERIRRIGILIGTGNDAQGQSWMAAFQDQLEQLGWVEGQNARIELVWGGADINHIRSSAAKMVGSNPDVIFVYSVRVLNAVRALTRELPVVFIATNDPVGLGIVESLARPGGNLTGFTLYEVSVAGKLVELLKEMLPVLSRVALLYNPNNSSASLYWRLIQSIATSHHISPVSCPGRDAPGIEQAIATFAREPNGGVVLPADVTTTMYRDLIATLAAQHRVPVVYSFRSVVENGGLISYGPDTSDLFRRAASYVDRLLKGEKPSDLPVQAPTKFTLAVNLKAARALGLNVPTSILLRADEVIE